MPFDADASQLRIAPRGVLQGGRRSSRALPGGDEALRQAVTAELQAAANAGFDVAGEALDAEGRRVLVHRAPSGELRLIGRIEPFRCAEPGSA